MARLKEREEALKLRKQGQSYSQIKKTLGISKSTLSYWLQDYPLSKERIRELRDWNEERIEKFRQTMSRKREERLQKIYEEEKKQLLPLTDKELFVAGLCLYWGEGTKAGTSALKLANTNPVMIQFFIEWLKHLGVPRSKLNVRLHLYKDMDILKETTYWAAILRIPISQFSPPYVKMNSSERVNYKGGFGHGTCNIGVGSVPLKEKVMMGIKAIASTYSR
ncbi:MAG TPA: helix-turn-helix domain-containing protein [Candidatus Paceibacterota bacterium]